MYLFKIWSADRQEKYFILVKVNRSIFQDVLIQASTKFRKAIEAIVLEKDGTLIDDEEILILLKDETLIGLASGERWCDPKSITNASNNEIPITETTIPSITTITDLTELGLKNNIIDVSFEPTSITNIIKSDISECSEAGNTSNDMSYISDEISTRQYDQFEQGNTTQQDKNFEYVWSEFEIPWDKIPAHMLKSCEEGKKNKQIITQIIHIIVYEMRQIKTNIPSRSFKFVALKLAERFPYVFRDLDEDGVAIGDGTHSVTMKLLDRNNYLNRPQKRSSTANGETTTYRKNLQIAPMGCSNWEPPDENPNEHLQMILKTIDVKDKIFFSLLEQTYADQRKFFNNMNHPPTINDIKSNWPSILTTPGIFWHFKKLTSIDLKDVMQNIKDKSNKLVEYGLQKGIITNRDLISNCDYNELTYFIIISKYFKEDFTSIYKTFKDVDKSSIPIENLPLAPSVVRFENSREYGYIIYLERTPINDSIYTNFVEAFVTSFALYFITNQQYATEICFTMEMMQRYYCKIYPDIDSKCQKKSRRRARFQTFMNKLQKF